MVGKYKAYSEYKDSGVEWLGYIPEHWKINKLGYIGEMRNGLTYSPDDITNDGQGVLVLRSSNIQNGKLRFDDNVYVNKKIPEKLYTKENDILICSRNGSRNLIGKNALITYEYEKYSYGAFMLIYRSSYNLYLSWVFNSILFIHQSSSFLTTTINQLTVDNLKNFEIPIPSVKEQKEIINFLTYETFKIDTLIEKQQQLIKLLEEKRQAVISHAVTKGLNPNVPMKDSGVEWLGKIPEHWEIFPAFSVVQEGQIKNNNGKEKNVLSLSYGNIIQRDVENNFGLLPDSFNTYQVVNCGDIILRLTDLQNDKRSLRVGLVNQRGIITSAYLKLTTKERLDGSYLYYLLHTYDISKVFYGMGGGLRQTLRFEEFRRLPIIIPPLEKQQEIVAFLIEKLKKFSDLVMKSTRQIELLKERRTALISAAVTGKIDVRDWQAPTATD